MLKEQFTLNNFRRITLLLTLLLSCTSYAQHESSPFGHLPSSTALEYDPKIWKEFVSNDGRFSILFPGAPNMRVVPVNIQWGKVEMYTFTLQTFAQYGVRYYDLPQSVEKSDKVKLFLNGLRTGAVRGVNGQLLEEKEVSLDGHAGLYFKMQIAEGYISRNYAYVVNDRVYQIVITMWEKDAPKETAQFLDMTAAKFFNSFKITAYTSSK